MIIQANNKVQNFLNENKQNENENLKINIMLTADLKMGKCANI